MSPRLSFIAFVISSPIAAQPPVPPPVGTDLNIFIPGDWDIQTLGNTGWVWSSTMGYGGSGGLMMDCSACSNYQESTIWSPWLDLSNDPQIDITFRCAIVGGSMGVPPPIFVLRDGVGGPSYEYRYGFANLIPPPDEVIPSTIDASPPLDAANVEWVEITYPFYAGLNNDSVRIGLGSGIPMGGYALLDDVGIGGIPTGLTPLHEHEPATFRHGQLLTVRSNSPLQLVELIDLSGRCLMEVSGSGHRDVDLPIGAIGEGIHVLRVWQESGPVVIKVGL